MSDEPPPDAGDGPGPLPRCGRVVLAAVGIRVEVQDFGHWRPPPADPGYRGRGLAVIHNLAEEVTLDFDESGTRVAFTVPDDPPPLAQRPAGPGAAQWWATGSGNAR